MKIKLGSEVLLGEKTLRGRVIKCHLAYGSSIPSYTVEYWLEGHLKAVELYEDEIDVS